MAEKIIPSNYSKGFHSIFTGVDPNENIDFVLEKLSYVKERIKTYNLSKKDSEVIDKLITSYNKLIKNISLEKEDMVLKEHEIVELKKISNINLARYFVYRYKYNIYPKLNLADEYPPCLQIEPTSICNFRCVMCFQIDQSFSHKSNGFMGLMSMDIFKKTIDEIAGKIEAVTFASRGEPTLHKNFVDMLNYCEGKFLALKMNTNASRLNENLIHSILSSDLQTIVFSIDARDKIEYEKIRVGGNFEKVQKNLELFNDIRTKHYSREDKIVRISGVKINQKQNVEDMKNKWGDLVDSVAFVNYTPWENSYENNINNIKTPCPELWLRMFVWHDGKVNPCDYDYKSELSKWNMKDNTITDIWTSNEYNEYRTAHLQEKRKTLSPCNRCNSC